MRILDVLVVATYFVAVFFVGILSRGRKHNVDEYFTAHGTFKGWIGRLVIGLSIAASFFSGVTFIVMSSFAYSTGLQIVLGLISIPIAWVMLRFWFLERYLAAHNSGPYDIVEKRLHPLRVLRHNGDCLAGTSLNYAAQLCGLRRRRNGLGSDARLGW